MKASQTKLTDNSPMPDNNSWNGVKMANIPANYLLWIYDNKKCSDKVRDYIHENLQDLRNENLLK